MTADRRTTSVNVRNGWRCGARAVLVLTALMVLWLPGSMVHSQVRMGRVPSDATDDLGTRGASLDTDPDADSLMKVVPGYVQDRKYREACLVLQQLIDKYGGKLTTADNRLFLPVRGEIERMLFELPPEGIAIYRQSADGEAKALRATAAQGDEEARLAELVRRYFASSLGGDAAYRLGSLLLDRYEFAGARAAFRKARLHPLLSVGKADLLLRLAVASARAHDPDGAAAAVRELESLNDARIDAPMMAHLRKEVAAAGTLSVAGSESAAGWPMEYGRPSRDAVMPSLPPAIEQGNVDLTFLWPPYRFDLGLSARGGASSAIRQPGMYPDGSGNSANRPVRRQDLVSRWEKNGWFPAVNVLLAENQIMGKAADGSPIIVSRQQLYLKAHDTLLCLDADTGHLVFRAPPESEKRSIPSVVEGYYPGGYPGESPNQPISTVEVSLFGDRIGKSISLHEGIVYQLEGTSPVVPAVYRGRMGVGTSGGKGNVLAGYDACSGKLVFRAAADNLDYSALGPSAQGSAGDGLPPAGAGAVARVGPGEPPAVNIRFLAAPIPCGRNLLIPLEENSTQFLLAIDPANRGKVVWKTMLCDGPSSGAARWSPIAVAAEGSDVYVAGGRGVIAAMDGADGVVRWAVKYARPQADRNPYMGFGSGLSGLRTLNASGWEQDAIIVRGGLLVVTPSDSGEILLLDRSSGAPKGPRIDRGPYSYCLGVSDDGL